MGHDSIKPLVGRVRHLSSTRRLQTWDARPSDPSCPRDAGRCGVKFCHGTVVRSDTLPSVETPVCAERCSAALLALPRLRLASSSLLSCGDENITGRARSVSCTLRTLPLFNGAVSGPSGITKNNNMWRRRETVRGSPAKSRSHTSDHDRSAEGAVHLFRFFAAVRCHMYGRCTEEG